MDAYEEYVYSQANRSGEWKSAVDPKSGRTYYYNTRTKETTWNKPLELATPEERREMITKKNETLNFFREMERNIKLRIQRAREYEDQMKSHGFYSLDEDAPALIFDDDCKEDRDIQRVRFNSTSSNDGGKGMAVGNRQRLGSFGQLPPRRVRTISTMDDEILMTMKQSNGEDRRNTIYNKSRTQTMYVAEEKFSNYASSSSGAKETSPFLKSESKDLSSSSSSSKTSSIAKKRRNSTGTIYITTTMSSQDNAATIECVCVVIRAHMIAAAKENIVPLSEYDVFKDIGFANNHYSNRSLEYKDNNPMALIPSLQTVKDFFTLIFSKSQLESDCIIMALIYCERLVKETKGRLCIRYDNWRSILFACLVMASKVWDDLSMWNVDFSQVSTSFDLARINALELAMLEALKYVIRVSASEYAKYYFLLRSMMVRLGLTNTKDSNYIRPLDIAGARKLQLSTERYQEISNSKPSKRRHSVHEGIEAMSLNRNYSEGYSVTPTKKATPVVIEQLIHTEHMDADGSMKRKPSAQSMKLTPKKAEAK